jgi:hypothetical protein
VSRFDKHWFFFLVVELALEHMVILHFGCHVSIIFPFSFLFYGQGTSSGNSTGIAQRARHPDELKREDGKWMIDIDYYLSQQVLFSFFADSQSNYQTNVVICYYHSTA